MMSFKALIIFFCILVLGSCRGTSFGGTNADLSLTPTVDTYTEYDLIPAGERISYTINGYTQDGKQKLNKLSQRQAELLVLNEAADKYACDRLIDPRYTVRWRGKRIESITVSGRPGVYRMKNRNEIVEQSTQQTSVQGRVILHEVNEGETLRQIADYYKVLTSDLVKWNSLTTTTLKPGMKLKIHLK